MSRTSDNETFMVKLLIPSASAGIILGKGGETIICLQSQYCTNIKLSRPGDFFPGTMERVCVILGSQKGIRAVLDIIVEKIRDKPDCHGVPSELKVKLVVPQSTATMIVGKGGDFIARVQKESSARVHMTHKAQDESSLQERIITVQGETSAMSRALDMILEKIFSDSTSTSCPNISYTDAQTGSCSAGAPSSNAASQLHTGIIPNHPSFAMLRYSLRYSGYAELAIEEIVAAVYTLASYGFLSYAECTADGNVNPTGLATMLGMFASSADQPYPGSTSTSTGSAVTNYDATVRSAMPASAMTASGYANISAANASIPYGTYQHLVNSDNYGQTAAYPYYGYGVYNLSDYSGSNCIPPPPPPPAPPTTGATNCAENVTYSFEVGEHIVGALLGPGGRSIVDLQTCSGVTIEVSQKGVFAPGTRNRIVTLTGSAPAVQSAAYFIKQCIDREETRRSSSAQPTLQSPSLPPSDMSGHPWSAPQHIAR